MLKAPPKWSINHAITDRRACESVSESVENRVEMVMILDMRHCWLTAATRQSGIGLDPILEITSSRFQQQNKGLAFGAGVIRVRETVEGQGIDRVLEEATAVDVTAYVVVSGVSVGDVRYVIPVENGQAKSD